MREEQVVLRRVFLRSIATVIGPTPPGTGVIQAAFFEPASNDVADGFFRSIGGVMRLMPTSMMIAPSAHVLGCDQVGFADGDY